MAAVARWGIATAVVLAVAGVVVAKQGLRKAAAPVSATAGKLPRLVDLGARSCVPCKAMAPILDQLRTDYAGRMGVEFIDVWKNERAAAPFSIRMIPTQIFYAADGRELYRHEGFYSREEILAKWKALGVEL